jgi:hypothetical protein
MNLLVFFMISKEDWGRDENQGKEWMENALFCILKKWRCLQFKACFINLERNSRLGPYRKIFGDIVFERMARGTIFSKLQNNWDSMSRKLFGVEGLTFKLVCFPKRPSEENFKK